MGVRKGAHGAVHSESARRTVTVLFADIVGSTALAERLDPEVVDEVLEAYARTARTVVERHGGTIEKFVGDAVMAVFGVPVIHEDDALRAARAAIELRAAASGLVSRALDGHGDAIRLRIGIDTGEVLWRQGAGGDRLVTGDATNTAARLQAAAGAGEILLGPVTARLVASETTLTALGALELKGKAVVVTAARLESVQPAGFVVSAASSPFVGRGPELDRIARLWSAVRTRDRAGLVTVVGQPGVGKSRLAREFLGGSGARFVLRARIPSYGATSLVPLARMFADAMGVGPDQVPDRGHVEALFGRDLPFLAPLGAIVGVAGTTVVPEEVPWTIRRALGHLAAEGPVVLVLDDLQWADDALVDILERALTDVSSPIFVLTLARPEIAKVRREWLALSDEVIELEPLDEAAAAELAAHLLPAAVEAARARVTRAAEGNPLFIEQFARLVEDGRDPSASALPPTVQAVLAARLERLAPPERDALRCASVVGRAFTLDDLEPLTRVSSRRHLSASLARLVGEGFVESSRSGFRFRHLLVRDVTYASASKRQRTDLHLRMADVLHGRDGRLNAEAIADHLSMAATWARDLASADAEAIAGRAAESSRKAADVVLRRGDLAGAIALRRRAVELAPVPGPRAIALAELAQLLVEAGDLTAARAALDEARRLGPDDRGRFAVEVVLARIDEDDARTSADRARIRSTLRRLLQETPPAGMDAWVARAWRVLAWGHWNDGDLTAFDAAERRAIAAAHAADDPLEEALVAEAWAAYQSGPMPASQAVARLEPVLADPSAGPIRRETALQLLGILRAQQGRLGRARECLRQAETLAAELGLQEERLRVAVAWIIVEMVAGHPERAEGRARAMGSEVRVIVAPHLAHALVSQGRYAEAAETLRSAYAVTRGPALTDPLARIVAARVLAANGECVAAIAEGTAATKAAAVTDLLNLKVMTGEEFGIVLRDCGDPAGALAAWREARARALAKEDVVRAARLGRRIGEIEARAAGIRPD